MAKNTIKSILITGASRGIGASLALAYAKSEVTLYLIARDIKSLEKVAAACRCKGAACYIAIADVTDKNKMRELVLKFYQQSPLDLIIANAGVSSVSAKNWQQEPDDIFDSMDFPLGNANCSFQALGSTLFRYFHQSASGNPSPPNY